MNKRHKDPIKRISRRKLKKIEKTERLLWDKEEELVHRLHRVQESIKKLRSLRKRAQYWIGKRKAEKCPIYRKERTEWGPVSCPIETPDYSTTYSNLFESFCFYCKRSKKRAIKEAVLVGLFEKDYQGSYR